MAMKTTANTNIEITV